MKYIGNVLVLNVNHLYLKKNPQNTQNHAKFGKYNESNESDNKNGINHTL
jgi:hypothetical protein